MSGEGERQMHLAAFFSAGPVSGHHGGWRHPDADPDLLSAGCCQRVGRALEEGRFGAWAARRRSCVR